MKELREIAVAVVYPCLAIITGGYRSVFNTRKGQERPTQTTASRLARVVFGFRPDECYSEEWWNVLVYEEAVADAIAGNSNGI